jgi:hypothetical protein
MKKIAKRPPAEQAVKARVSPLNGVAPPREFQFRPGTSGNRAGRACAGSSWLEWVNALAHWPEVDVRAVATDKSAPMVQRAAARDVLRWVTTKTTRAGLPVANDVANRILDRTRGKPVQSVITQQITEPAGDFENMPIEQMRVVVSILETAARQVPPALASPSQDPVQPEEKSQNVRDKISD